MDEIIAKLETASEGSRELDADIFEAVGGLPKEFFGSAVTGHHRFRGGTFDLDTADGYHHLAGLVAPTYTTSIDTALSLVSDEARPFFMVTFSNPARAGAHDGNREFLYFEGATPALALCIAALKERAAKSSSKAA